MSDTSLPSIADNDERQQGGIQVISRMSRIMRALSSQPQSSGMSLAAIATHVDLPRSTVQRIITALVAENIVEPAGPTGFRIGPAVGQMMYQTHSDIVAILKPYAELLSHKLQETVCLARIQMQKLNVVETVIGEQVLRVVPQLGINPPAHRTAAGKVLLSSLDEIALQEWIDREPLSAQEHAVLRGDIEQARRQGFAMDTDQVVAGISAIAVAICTYRGTYAAMVLVPTARMQPHRNFFLQELQSLQATLQKLLSNQQPT
jgi:DNA-binding IclR family transcriptional regulator